MKTILTIFGTRPEAIKLAPVITELSRWPDMRSVVCVTAQHRHMLDQVLDVFGIQPQYDLDLMRPSQSLADISSAAITGLYGVMQSERPDVVIVHGDTTTTLAGSLAAYYSKTKLCHVEAGLRTYDKYSPFPEEVNRKVASVLADIHCAPTLRAKANLLAEGVRRTAIKVTGNTVIDALLQTRANIRNSAECLGRLNKEFSFLDARRDIVLVTAHRRENFGERFDHICNAILDIAERCDDINIVFPVHLNPNVQGPVQKILAARKRPNIFLVPPLDYLKFVYLLDRCRLVLTDSGGIQEEAPAVGKPVLVMRDTTERPEAIAAGTAKLVGCSRSKITETAVRLLRDTKAYRKMSMAQNPFGDGRAAKRIVKTIYAALGD